MNTEARETQRGSEGNRRESGRKGHGSYSLSQRSLQKQGARASLGRACHREAAHAAYVKSV